MAMILDAFLGNFKEMLTKMAEEEVGMLFGVPGEIEKLQTTVVYIQGLLSDAEKKQTTESIKNWLLELTDVMYDADDIMDLCQIKAEERSERRGSFDLYSSKFGCGISMLSCLRNPIFAHEMGTKIKKLNSRLNEIYKRKSELTLNESRDVFEPSNVRPMISPSVAPVDIVGDKIEEDAAMLLKLLTSDEESVKENVSVVAIVGMPGIGKSALAKKIFYDPEIEREFPLKIWACVSKDLKEIKLLQCIIRGAKGDYGAAEERSELVQKLTSVIQNNKFLLVLDDVWPDSQDVWNGLLREAMIGGARGSRVLVTTRDDDVARFFQPTTTHHVHKLSEKDAWSILAKQVALIESDSETLKDIGLELVKKCDGLPLAIIAIGGVLRERGKDILKWRKISESPLWSLYRRVQENLRMRADYRALMASLISVTPIASDRSAT
ncbi:Disease resistance protein (CC-NBS-LRR) [Rhynchospora pubera]|uniref:Disease resistance protein (CC-NBS-LRR) n=1 Tax=Rhynchospora pubera TaxID=906938 RepID=A0AAV8G134_9POAL|nr:Disease resistance protein (CC-NBS-LRR) [Rhynchospora pubera]